MGVSRNNCIHFNGITEWIVMAMGRGKQVGGFSICNAMLTNCLSVQVFMKFFVPGKPKCYEKI